MTIDREISTREGGDGYCSGSVARCLRVIEEIGLSGFRNAPPLSHSFDLRLTLTYLRLPASPCVGLPAKMAMDDPYEARMSKCTSPDGKCRNLFSTIIPCPSNRRRWVGPRPPCAREQDPLLIDMPQDLRRHRHRHRRRQRRRISPLCFQLPGLRLSWPRDASWSRRESGRCA